MAKASGGFSGMAELIADLGKLGEAAQREGAVVVQQAATSMASELQSAYPSHEGVLRGRVVVENRSAGSGPALRWKVRSKAPHAHLYEYGTVRRFTADTGANRGTMPATPTFVPAAIRTRRRMVEGLKAVIRRQRVRGMTGQLEVREA